MAYPRVGATTITTGVTTVDCQKQVRSWRLLRSLIELLIPTCNCTFIEDHDQDQLQAKQQKSHANNYYYPHHPQPSFACSNNIVTGTIFAKEMQGGFLRIALESTSPGNGASTNSNSLLATPVWTMYCNSRKVGYAIKRRPSEHDLEALRMMGSVVVGAGIISGNYNKEDDEIMYLRANFERVCGSANSESFHLIDPDQSIGQELSIFLYRSR
ncbi:protein MIZU-KUSSEI 1-like [Prunus yedoensis var. nudiflora]|uniref:Protein MIZU-KUSSEI 1-like n=1 Tax=Prunus yedoensis var. nudiflora TaxID=2094558 RepID=A0A314ZB91_PRUYE|nr:protein MIZU-KUSSEI 1-like [Prunus yedoensis var. nudiflora]